MMMRPIRLGVGGRIGSGRQWMSWIALEDVIGILRFAIENGEVRGAVNVVSPQPLRNLKNSATISSIRICPRPSRQCYREGPSCFTALIVRVIDRTFPLSGSVASVLCMVCPSRIVKVSSVLNWRITGSRNCPACESGG